MYPIKYLPLHTHYAPVPKASQYLQGMSFSTSKFVFIPFGFSLGLDNQLLSSLSVALGELFS